MLTSGRSSLRLRKFRAHFEHNLCEFHADGKSAPLEAFGNSDDNGVMPSYPQNCDPLNGPSSSSGPNRVCR
jgi:hypothetical protein